jgi:hypothetical protein
MLYFDNIKLYENLFVKWIVMCDMNFVMHIDFE